MLEKILAIITEAEYMKNCYHWKAPASAGSRRAYERKHSHELVEWDEGGQHYTAEYTVQCSCSNIYAQGTYTRDGKRTNLTAIKNSAGRLLAAAEEVIA